MPWKPVDEHDNFPTLGWHVLDWIYDNLTVYDGPTMGDPLTFTQEQANFVLRFYEVDPQFEGPATREGERHMRRGRIVRRALLSRPKGWGKAECLTAELPTPTGWTTVSDVRPGDELFGADGSIIRCVAVHPIVTEDAYRVTLSDGTSSIFSGEHSFDVDVFVGGSERRRKTLTVAEMADIGLVYPRPLTSGRTKAVKGGVSRFALPPQPVLQLPEADLPMDPYLLGLWLGDGDSDCSRITCSDSDLPWLLSQFDAMGCEHGEPVRTNTAWRIRFGRGWANRLLRTMGLLNNKHIPTQYLRASESQRLALLQGLMDTDGYIEASTGQAEFCVTNRQLAEQTAELIRTLGMKANVIEADARLYGRTVGKRYRVNFKPFSHLPVVQMPRKADRLVSRKRIPLPRVITAIESAQDTPMRCITVDAPDGLYLTGRTMWTTHNSPLVAALCLTEALADVVMDGWDANGQPVGRPWNSMGFKPLVQIVAVSEDQTANTYSPCIDMARSGPVLDNYDIEPMETFINVPRGRIEAVTSAGISREGFRPVFTAMDQALALDTPIPTPDGWRQMGELETGDYVFGSTGAVRISEAKPVSSDHDCYRVTFADGTSVVASAGHRWMSKRVHGTAIHERVRTTEEMLDGYRYRIPVAPPRPLPEADLPAHPYLLGVWLGDGTRGKCEISVGESDLDAVQTQLLDIGVETWPRRYARRDDNIPGVNLTFSRMRGYQGANRPEPAKAIMSLPCYLDKHIPAEYLTGSIEQRTQLVRGLMDADGHATWIGTCTFVNTNKRIVDGLIELLRSLGQVTSGAKWVADSRYTDGGKYRVNFTPRGNFQPFALPRKADRVRQHRNGPEWISITSIEPVDRVPVRCIAVDSEDHLFAAGIAGHLTHNTESWTQSNGGHRLARTIRRNTMKTGGSTIETPNAFEPGEDSIAEQSWHAHQTQLKGKNRSRKRDLLLDHREASATTDIYDEASLRAGLLEAYGDSASDNGGWVNIDGVIDEFWDENTDVQEARRYFLNQITHASDSFLSAVELAACVEPKPVQVGTPITLGFDGSEGRSKGKADATALVACRLSDGYCWQVLIREPPNNPKEARQWTAPVFEFDVAVAQMFRDFKVVGFYADPSGWEAHVANWEKLYGRKLRVRGGGEANHPIMAWPRGKTTNVVPYIKRLKASILASGLARTAAMTVHRGDKTKLIGVGEFTYDGSHELTQHLLNARMRKHTTGYLLSKDFPESPRKIDGAYALVLAWKARLDALAKGLDRKPESSRQVVTLG